MQTKTPWHRLVIETFRELLEDVNLKIKRKFQYEVFTGKGKDMWLQYKSNSISYEPDLVTKSKKGKHQDVYEILDSETKYKIVFDIMICAFNEKIDELWFIAKKGDEDEANKILRVIKKKYDLDSKLYCKVISISGTTKNKIRDELVSRIYEGNWWDLKTDKIDIQ